MKKLFSGFLKFLFSGIGMSVLASCAMLEDSFNEPVRSFFELYTDTAAIEKYEVKGYEGIFSAGTYYVGCGEDFTVYFYLRNPKEYAFTDNVNIRMSHPEFKALDAQSEWPHLWGAPLNPMASYTLIQNPNDMSEIILTVKKDFLRACEGGFNISPNFDLTHPLSGVPFESYSDLRVVCNSLPLEPYGGVVMIYDSNKYVVCFNMGSEGNFSSTGIHKDIKSIKITSSNGQSDTYDFNIAADGTLSVQNGGTKMIRTAPADLDVNTEAAGLSFIEDANSFYYLTGTTQSTDNIIYTLTVTDKGGLSSMAETSVKAEMLGPALITTSRNGTNLSVPTQALSDPFDADTNVRIDQDSSTGMGSIRIAPPTMTKNPNNVNHPVSGVTVYYELYSSVDGINYESTPYDSGKLTSAKTIPVVPAYTKIKVSSRKRTYIDSETVVGYVKPVVKTVYVSAGASSGLGTKASPVNSIATAISFFENNPAEPQNRVILLSDITENLAVNDPDRPVTVVGSNSSGVATVRKIIPVTAGSKFAVSGGECTFTDITFDSGINYTSSENLMLRNCTVNGDVNLNGTGNFILSGTSSVTHTEANPYKISLNGKYVYTDNTLTKTPAAWIEPSDYSQHSGLNYVMVKPVSGVTLTDKVADNFMVIPHDNVKYYCVLGPSNSGVLTKNLSANVQISNNPGKIKFKLMYDIRKAFICSLEDENGNPVVASSLFMGVMIRDDILSNHQVNKSNSSYCVMSNCPVPPSGTEYTIYMSCTYNGMTYSSKTTNYPISDTLNISSVATFKAAAEYLNSISMGTGLSHNINLTEDITLDDSCPVIGADNNMYYGTFNGHGHTITLKKESKTSKGAAVIDWLADGGVVKNLVVKGSYINNGSNNNYKLSAAVGNNYGSVYNVVNYAAVSGNDFGNIGGIVRENMESGKIYNCANYGDISNNYVAHWEGTCYCNAGGIAGTNRGNIKNCFNYGRIYTKSTYESESDGDHEGHPGAIAGYLGTGGFVGYSVYRSGCEYRGTVSNSNGVGRNESGQSPENLYGIDAANAAEKLSTLNDRSGYPSSISVDQLWTWSIISDLDSPYNGWPELNVVRTNP